MSWVLYIIVFENKCFWKLFIKAAFKQKYSKTVILYSDLK